MTATVQVTVTDDGIALVTLDPPRKGTAAGALRGDLAAAWDDLAGRTDLAGVILRSDSHSFALGLLSETPYPVADAAALGDLCARIEAAPVPVIAAISGLASGAGLELALAAHYRIADHHAHLLFPGILSGLLPVAGATQRLPRLVGVQAALEILLAGKPLIAVEADRIGLIDAAVSQTVETAALEFLRDLIASDQADPRPVAAMTDRFRDYAANADVIRRFRTRQAANPIEAGPRMVDCVEAAFMMPFEIGLRFERATAEDVASSASARALGHLRRAEQDTRPQPADPVRRAAIAGSGEVAAKLAVRLLDAGLPVTLAAPTEAGRAGAQEMIVRLYHLAEAEGRVSEQALAKRIARLELTTGLSALASADAVFVPLPSGADAAQKALHPVAEAAAKDAPLVVLGQGHQVATLAATCPAAGRLMRVSFADDPLVARLMELYAGPGSDPALLDRLHQLGRRLGISVLRRPDDRRSLCDRLAGAALNAADQLLVQGASPYQVDKALRGYGFAEGPYERIDAQGLDRAGGGPGLIGQALMDDGRLGRNAGQGYYRYEGDAPLPDQLVLDRLTALSADLAIPRRNFPDAEIVRRVMAAMANTGARLLERGLATVPGDVDLAATDGLGLARWRGGPLFQADQTGLMTLQRALGGWTDEDPEFWAPAPLLAEMVKNGRHFTDAQWPVRALSPA
ncbi:enoyl-CoA hydratase-related protein [Actibacterium ureilyticum]|uniref:enoyl-CoA hydratase-related protein n=1 Tax=Actibacterium ureilyticum TaxID=1590614 RepID=UPI0015956A37|nr:enoyl-CoA hydratase-related protein [Actibacterium ureilyticum]